MEEYTLDDYLKDIDYHESLEDALILKLIHARLSNKLTVTEVAVQLEVSEKLLLQLESFELELSEHLELINNLKILFNIEDKFDTNN